MFVRLPRRLPPLSGWVLLLYRILWPVLAVLALVSIVATYRGEPEHQRNARTFYDLGLINTGQSLDGQLVSPFSPAAKRLFSGQETLLAVNGTPLPADYIGDATVMAGPEGATVDLTLRRADGSVHHLSVRRDTAYLRDAYRDSGLSFTLRRWLSFAFVEGSTLILIGTGCLLFVRRPRDPVSALFAIGWAVGSIDLPTIWPTAPLLLQDGTGALNNLLVTLGLVAFPDGRLRSRWSWAVVALAILAVGLILLGDYAPAINGLATLMIIPTVLALAAVALTRYRATPPGEARQQMKFAILGFVACMLFVVVAAILQLLSVSSATEGQRAWMLLLRTLAFACDNIAIAGGLLVSLLRYRLYDADAVISRSAAYAFLTLLLGAAFAGSEKVIEVMGEEFFGEGSRALAAGLGAAIAATLVAPLHNRVHHWTEKHFQRALSALRAKLPRNVADMREYASIDELLAFVAAQIEKGVRATHVAVLMRGQGGPWAAAFCRHIGEDRIAPWIATWADDQETPLECVREDPVFPLRLRLHAEGAGTIGWLLLGPRPDGSFYGKDEREGLIEIADPIARALHIIRQRAARDGVLHSRIHALEAELATIRRALPA